MIVDVSEGMDGAGTWFALAVWEVETRGAVFNIALEADEYGSAVLIVEGDGLDLCWDVVPGEA
jgi:hypothetical protein